MPRYYFHLRDGPFYEIDPLGLEFPTLGHAVLDARMAACEIMHDRGACCDGQRFEIADENGLVIETIPFRQAVRLS